MQSKEETVKNLINCGTCGYPLTPEERTTLVEKDGVMVKPAPAQEPALVIYQGEIAKSNLPKGFTGMLYTTPPAQPAPVQEPVAYRQTGWAAHRDHYAVPVLFNPYTGHPRDVRDVQSDPQGILIVPPGKVEMLAAKPTHQQGLQVATPPAQPAPVQEPVAVDCCANCLRPEREHQDGKCPKPFTTVWHAWDYDFPPDAPPAAQRQWVGLTQNEMDDITCGMVKSWVIEQLARSIEAKLKEKNT
jgi:hypothetical protein